MPSVLALLNPFLAPDNPMLASYSHWLLGWGERPFWSKMTDEKLWIARFEKGRWVRDEMAEGVTLSVVDFYDSDGQRQCTVKFAEELGCYPLQSDFYSPKFPDWEYFIHVERHVQRNVGTRSIVIPLWTNQWHQMYHIDEDTVRLNQEIDPSKFTVVKESYRRIEER